MKPTFIRIAETALIAGLALLGLCAACWAGPPPPPNILAQVPATPVGGAEASALTAMAVAAYGYWKNRK